ncbi:unnamed protein product [Spirodela intermedia]|uniref:Uncharacterized protein n=2 Tax=Spirodela intermedia TaxID=51605 RepID=A0A7I8JDN3_SPIIN|nr:unnamed protein product [Spirodela intermedia]CAA6668209.1 unnamed protein product [Spirodela intermedia]CAA7405040.1 unnamed protein product [Spirodela intermedia]
MEEQAPRKHPSTDGHLPVSLFVFSFSLLLLLFLLFPAADRAPPCSPAEGGAACAAAVEDAMRRREMQQQAVAGGGGRYISYEFLRADVVPCNRPGIPYYNCHAMPRANPYSRGCLTITRCARDSGP